MAKKVIFSFSGIPTVNFGFNVEVLYLGLPIFYSCGRSDIEIEYLANGTPDEPPTKLETQLTLNATVSKTTSFLSTYYANSNVFYKQVGNTIEMFVTLDNIDFYFVNPIDELTITVEDISEATNLNLK